MGATRCYLAATLLALMGACTSSEPGSPAPPVDDGAGEDAASADGAVDGAADIAPPVGTITPDCDPLMPSRCSLPWPSSLYLVPDESRETGYTLTFGADTLPRNHLDAPVGAEPFLDLDGYGVGTTIVVDFPGLDITSLPREDHMAPSLDPDGNVALMEWTDVGLERVPCFVEWDDHSEPGDRALFVRPAVIPREATRYVVAFRHLTHEDGTAVQASPAFRALRDGVATDPLLAARAGRFEEIFEALEGAGWKRAELTLAWDFVTASSQAMHGAILHMRDQGFLITGKDGPELTLTSVEEHTVEENPHIALSIEGTFRVPSFVEEIPVGGETGYRLHLGADGLPVQNGWRDAPMWIRVPHVALTGEPMGLIQYGHGLNGLGSQVKGSFNSEIANTYGYIFFACDMIGMSEPDVDIITQILLDVTRFEVMADRLHQGMLDYLMLARGMRERFVGLPEIADRGITIDPSRLYYSGISQGGIYGATYMALSTDVARGHLGVPGQNYSVLMPRSVDFTPFFAVLRLTYPDAIDRAILMSAIQVLWDSTDPVSHYRHIREQPHGGTDPHDVLIISATGDYQVALLTNEITARSDLGVMLMPGYGKPVYGVEPTPYPHVGSGIVNYHFGNPWPPAGNLPPADEFGDPHGKPRKLAHHQQQMIHFFETGEIIDVCGGDGCTPE